MEEQKGDEKEMADAKKHKKNLKKRNDYLT